MKGVALSAALTIAACAAASATFPKGFLWGTATASYQIEGAYKEGGRGMSIWDDFSHTEGKTHNGDTGDVADDSYHRYEEDFDILESTGANAHRMSLSWSRILPEGTGAVNMAAVEHYRAVLNSLWRRNITVAVTLYHWDLPSALQSRGGWLNPDSAMWFEEYAAVCFTNFGDRVAIWTTFNEPHEVTVQGYLTGTMAPGRCGDPKWCPSGGDPWREPYTVGHNVLRAHARAVRLYRKSFGPVFGGSIGIVLNSDHYEPLRAGSAEDAEACARNYDFQFGWFANPVVYGDYPKVMRDLVGDRLPAFTAEETAMLKGSVDYLGLNHYTSMYCGAPQAGKVTAEEGWYADRHVTCTYFRDGVAIGEKAASSWLYVVPWGIERVLLHIAGYGFPLYVTENGVDVPNESDMPIAQALDDQFRVRYLRDYLGFVESAIASGRVDLRGYFAWSLLDNFEWADGYSMRFGLTYIDYANNLARYPKQSLSWYKSFIAAHK